MATLYLHIDMHKTGTTAIQRFCAENRKALLKRGYCYPLIFRRYKDVGILQNGHFLIASEQDEKGKFKSPEGEKEWRRRMAYIVRLFQRYQNIILSDERISIAVRRQSPGIWMNLKEQLDCHKINIKVIIYLRRQDQYLFSFWAQRIKVHSLAASRLTWADAPHKFLKQTELDYYTTLEKASACFGKENIIVRVYDRARFTDGDVLPDFLEAIGLSMDDDFVLPKIDHQPSLRGNFLEIQRILNLIPDLNSALPPAIRKLALTCSCTEQKWPCSMFSRDELEAFLQQYEQSNQAVARDYLGDENQPLFSLPEEDLPQKWKPDNPYMYEDIIRYFGQAMLLQKMLEQPWLWRFLKMKTERLRYLIKGGHKIILAYILYH